MNINIERLIDCVKEENECYADYMVSGKTLYNGDYEKLKERKEHLKYAEKWHYAAQNATCAVMDVLDMDKEQRKRLYIAARAVIRWRIKTSYAFLIPDNMKQQLEKFIFS